VKREHEDQIQREDVGVEASKKLYPAIELLNDPQGLADVILKRIKASGSNTYKFEHKLLMMNFVTRIVGNHELILLPLYPLLQRYMGGTQRDVTAILAYTVQACHSFVPPEEIYGILKTIAHNFITERCSGEQMAVGINACRAICARVPSVLSKEDAKEGNSSTTTMDVDAFVRDLAAYSKHRDRSVSIAGKSWINFIREVFPSLLSGKDRGSVGSALHRAGAKPLRYGEQRIASGVEGAELLLEYETKKALYDENNQDMDEEDEGNSDDDDQGESYGEINDDEDCFEEDDHDDGVEEEGSDEGFEEEEEGSEDGFEEEGSDGMIPIGSEDEEDDHECEDSSDEVEASDDDEFEENNEIEEADEVAPELVYLPAGQREASEIIDTAKMSQGERNKLRQKVSSTRIFSTEDFVKMRKLVEREEQAKRDPRAAARLKRQKASGNGFVELSDDDTDDADEEDEERIHVKGVVTASDIMAEERKKRANKIERLEKIVAGREKFEHKKREGGSTNSEKKRKKLFVMTKFSAHARSKKNDKETARQARRNSNKRKFKENKFESKKRRRKF
jgi:protein SDA1